MLIRLNGQPYRSNSRNKVKIIRKQLRCLTAKGAAFGNGNTGDKLELAMYTLDNRALLNTSKFIPFHFEM